MNRRRFFSLLPVAPAGVAAAVVVPAPASAQPIQIGRIIPNYRHVSLESVNAIFAEIEAALSKCITRDAK